MAYTVINFKTKKALKAQVSRWINRFDQDSLHDGPTKPVRCYQPGLGPDLSNFTGRVALEGPHYPQAHTWYAEAELKDGIVMKVK